MNLYTNITANKRRTTLLLGLFLVVVIALGWVFARAYDSPVILYIVVIVSVGQALVSYYSGDKIALMTTGAIEIDKKDNPVLYRTVENLAITAGLPMPKIYIINDSAPNAFATGRDPQHSSVAVTTGLLERLEKTELEGVIAHELSHIGNYDIRLMMVVVVLVGVIAMLSDIFIRFRYFFGGRSREGGSTNGVFALIGLVAALLAPLAATLIQLAISRKREFLADASGAMLTRYPEGLANALQKISSYSNPMRRTSSATSHLFIANPLGKTKSITGNLFSTHPSIEERISALVGMKIE